MIFVHIRILKSQCPRDITVYWLLSQAIVNLVLSSGCVGPDIMYSQCYCLLLKHLKSSEMHWLHPDLAVSELTQRYEQQHLEAEWRSVLQSLSKCTVLLQERKLKLYIWIVKWLSKANCDVCLYRYDLRIRYIPSDFMEKFKDDSTTMLYFYQQVSNMCVWDANSW